jgi:hypothetical protein
MSEADYSGVKPGGWWLRPTGLFLCVVGLFVAFGGVYAILLWISNGLFD